MKEQTGEWTDVDISMDRWKNNQMKGWMNVYTDMNWIDGQSDGGTEE